MADWFQAWFNSKLLLSFVTKFKIKKNTKNKLWNVTTNSGLTEGLTSLTNDTLMQFFIQKALGTNDTFNKKYQNILNKKV